MARASGLFNSPDRGEAREAEGSAIYTFNEQTNYVPKRTIITVSVLMGELQSLMIQIFLACSTVDLIALMDQTTLAASLAIIGNALHASDRTSWISGGYFVYAARPASRIQLIL